MTCDRNSDDGDKEKATIGSAEKAFAACPKLDPGFV